MDVIIAKIRDKREACRRRCAPSRASSPAERASHVGVKSFSRQAHGGRLVLRGGLEAYFSGGAT
jgi:hypothetical protein